MGIPCDKCHHHLPVQAENDRRGSVVASYSATNLRRTTSLPPVGEADHHGDADGEVHQVPDDRYSGEQGLDEDYAADDVPPDSPVLDLPPTPSPPQVRYVSIACRMLFSWLTMSQF